MHPEWTFGRSGSRNYVVHQISSPAYDLSVKGRGTSGHPGCRSKGERAAADRPPRGGLVRGPPARPVRSLRDGNQIRALVAGADKPASVPTQEPALSRAERWAGGRMPLHADSQETGFPRRPGGPGDRRRAHGLRSDGQGIPSSAASGRRRRVRAGPGQPCGPQRLHRRRGPEARDVAGCVMGFPAPRFQASRLGWARRSPFASMGIGASAEPRGFMLLDEAGLVIAVEPEEAFLRPRPPARTSTTFHGPPGRNGRAPNGPLRRRARARLASQRWRCRCKGPARVRGRRFTSRRRLPILERAGHHLGRRTLHRHAR